MDGFCHSSFVEFLYQGKIVLLYPCFGAKQGVKLLFCPKIGAQQDNFTLECCDGYTNSKNEEWLVRLASRPWAPISEA
jgi:hypothetical protein